MPARGIGFRIGVALGNLSFKQTDNFLQDQFNAEKEGRLLDEQQQKALERDYQENFSAIRRGIAPFGEEVQEKRLDEVRRGKEKKNGSGSPEESKYFIRRGTAEHEKALPGRLEKLIQQIGPEEKTSPKTTGNKLVSIISSIETAAYLKACESEFWLLGDPHMPYHTR